MPEDVKEIGYKNALEMLDKLATSAQAKGFELDFGRDGLERSASNTMLDYRKVAEDISMIEAYKKPQSVRKQDLQTFQKDASIATTNASFKTDSAIPLVNKPDAALGKESSIAMRRAAQDIRKFADVLEKDIAFAERAIVKRQQSRGKGKTVMQTLSVQDQISDLEKISLGLDQKAFDDEQMKLIKEEVYALQDFVKEQNIDKLEESQRSFTLLRNRRLQDVINKLSVNS